MATTTATAKTKKDKKRRAFSAEMKVDKKGLTLDVKLPKGLRRLNPFR